MREDAVARSSQRTSGLLSSVLQGREIGAFAAVVMLITIGTFINSSVFLSSNNILNVVRNTAVVAIIGYGMTMLMVAGEFDLSVGEVMAVGAAILGIMVQAGYPLLFSVSVVLVLAALYGIFQGLLVTKLALPSLIITIGTMTLMRGVLMIVVGGRTFSFSSDAYPDLLTYFGGVISIDEASFLPVNQFPMQILWTFVLLGVMYYVLNRTPFGARSMFTGGARMSAARTGIDTDLVKISNFLIVAVLAAFTGIGQLAFTQAVGPSTGQGLSLVVIASVVIGGTDLFGGDGSIPGVFLGASVFALTQNILVLSGMGVRLFQVFTGLFIISAVLIEVLSRELGPEFVQDKYLNSFASIVTAPGEFFTYVREDIQDIDDPLAFQAFNGVVLSLFALVGIFVLPIIFGREFSLGIISGGIGALGTVPTVAFIALGVLTSFTAVPLYGATMLRGSKKRFKTSLQCVLYSLAPAVLLFVPILLAGFRFLDIVVGISAVLVALPVVYLLLKSTRILHEFDTKDTVVSVAITVIVWALVALFAMTQLSAA